MPGPWENYQPTTERKPWEKYGKTEAAPEKTMLQKVGDSLKFPTLPGKDPQEQARGYLKEHKAVDYAVNAAFATVQPGKDDIINEGINKVAGWVGKKAEQLYGSATKMPLSKKWVQTLPGQELSDRAKAVGAGLENKIYSSEYGLSKTKMLEKQARTAVDDLISAGSKKGETADTMEIIETGLKKAYERATKSSDPVGAKKIVDDIATKFMEHGNKIKLSDLNSIKRQLYDEVKWGGSEQTALVGQLSAMGKKGMAKAAKEYMEQLHPELKMMNQTDAALIKLQEALERTIGREANKDMVGLAAKALSVRSIPMAIFESTAGHPYVKETLAFALKKAAKAGLPNVKSAASGALKAGAIAVSDYDRQKKETLKEWATRLHKALTSNNEEIKEN